VPLIPGRGVSAWQPTGEWWWCTERSRSGCSRKLGLEKKAQRKKTKELS